MHTLNFKSGFAALVLAVMLPLGLAAAPLAVFNYKIFYTPEGQPMVETYFDISAKSIALTPDESGMLYGRVELTIIFKKYGEIVSFDKKEIESPIMAPHERLDFIDVERFLLDPGNYEVEINLLDLISPEPRSSNLTTRVAVPAAKSGAFFSDIELVSALRKAEEPSTLTKAGYDLVPMVSDSLLKTGMNEIIFYTELYGMEKRVDDERFLLKTYLKNTRTGEVAESTVRFSRESTTTVKPILTTVDISELTEGPYEIVVEARDSQNELHARAGHHVYRIKTDSGSILATLDDPSKTWVGKYTDPAELYDYVNSLRSVADKNETDVIDIYFVNAENVELTRLQRFFYSFWEAREPGYGEEAWMEYKEKIDLVNREFSTANKRGYDTDRGRIYLKYGPPNHVAERSAEPGSYPYEIWQYYKTQQFNNARFVFYDPTLLNTEYVLLHSEGVRGEVTNPRWRYLLQSRSLPAENIDHKDGIDHFGGRADDLFENPR